MTIRNDVWIEKHARRGMIDPFIPSQVKNITTNDRGREWHHPSREGPVVSFGLSSYGYDVRCSNEFKVFSDTGSTQVDPKRFTEDNFHNWVGGPGEVCVIPPNSFALTRSVEYIRLPKSVLAICLGKSTYARCGIIVNTTPLEPEWEGHITLELSNTTRLPAVIYPNEGIAQVVFYKASHVCRTSYADRKGKYQEQHGITLPRM